MSDQNTEVKTEQIGGSDQSELKMITFSLAGKDYGIDIMQVKEISRMLDFTYIPNAPYYVRGVYNLRGEIISVIDLRLLFHLPVPEKEEAASDEDVENLIVLQFGDYYLGVVVDRVDKVCTVSMSEVQAAHPFFSDISVQYINGLAHLDDRLYILLNVSLLVENETEGRFTAGMDKAPAAPQSLTMAAVDSGMRLPSIAPTAAVASQPPTPTAPAVAETAAAEPETVAASPAPDRTQQFNAFADGLAAVCGFYINDWNYEAVFKLFCDYVDDNGSAPEFKSANEYRQLIPFAGEEEDAIWSAETFDAVKALELESAGTFNAWCSWCGYGHAAYSMAAALSAANDKMTLRIWATDDDLLKISIGPNLTIQTIDSSHPILDFVEETKNGYKFKKNIAEKILFEYHSIENGNPFPKMKFIVAKGKVSFYNKETSKKIISELYAKMESDSYILVADYEALPESDFRLAYSGSVKIYQHL